MYLKKLKNHLKGLQEFQTIKTQSFWEKFRQKKVTSKAPLSRAKKQQKACKIMFFPLKWLNTLKNIQNM